MWNKFDGAKNKSYIDFDYLSRKLRQVVNMRDVPRVRAYVINERLIVTGLWFNDL